MDGRAPRTKMRRGPRSEAAHRMRSQPRCPIVVADDDAADRYLIQQAFEDSGVEGEVHFLEDGQVLVEGLTRQLATSRVAERLPCLILLDLNMPRMNGRDALRIIKSHPELKGIPIVVMTNSSNPDDVEGTYRDGANSYFTKPLSYSGLVDLVTLLKTYWLETASLPTLAAR
jgi:two-component system, response regulator